MTLFPRRRPSEPPTRSEVQQLLRALKHLELHAVWPLVYDASSQHLWYDGGEDILYIRLTASGLGGGYGWVEIKPTAGGGWVDGTATGSVASDPALELNGNGTLPGDAAPGNGSFRTEAWRDQNGVLRFRASKCPPCP